MWIFPFHGPVDVIQAVDHEQEDSVRVLTGQIAGLFQVGHRHIPLGQIHFPDNIIGQGIVHEQAAVLGLVGDALAGGQVFFIAPDGPGAVFHHGAQMTVPRFKILHAAAVLGDVQGFGDHLVQHLVQVRVMQIEGGAGDFRLPAQHGHVDFIVRIAFQ